MAGYFLFFRCWPGLTEPFPFEQFNALPDDDLAPALDCFAREQLRLPKVREGIKKEAGRRRRRFTDAIKKQSAMRLGGGRAPLSRSGPQVSFRQMRWTRVRQAERKDPLICRLAAYLGWWTHEKVNGHAVGFPAVWFCPSPTLTLAEHLVKELNRQRYLDYDKHQLEYHANPRFGFVSADGLSLGQRASIHCCINAIREGREPAVQDAKLALLIGQRALAVALDLAKAWPVDEDEELLAALPAPLAGGEHESHALAADSTDKSARSEAPETPEGQDGKDGSSSWVTAATLWKGKFSSYKELTKFRLQHPRMFRNPSKFKLEIHAGLWARYWAGRHKAGFETLGGDLPSIADDPSMQADTLTAAAQRAASLRARKQAAKQ